MIERRFGKTGWSVSEIGFGCWGIGGNWGAVSEPQAQTALKRALELGVNFFDTAYVYGDGRSERILGAALGRWKKEVYVATKVPAKNFVWPATPETRITDAFPSKWIVQCA